ncbi:MAG: cellulose biosynthesis cyclic di-GMP-binding regulatory protein BcsB [Candidatus Omnitrophota bacterium]
MKRIILSFFLCILCLPVGLLAQGSVIEKEIPVIGKDDIAIRGTFNDYDALVNIPEFIIVEEAVLSINLSHAKELTPNLSSLTVYLNGAPLKSIFLTPENSDNYQLLISLPGKQLLAGANQLRLSFFMRSLDAPCVDLDNPINWALIHSDSSLNFKFKIDDRLSVGSFEDIFVKSQSFLSSGTAFVLGNLNSDTLEAAALIARYLGANTGTAQDIKVFKGSVPLEDVGKYNLILLGGLNDFPDLPELRKPDALNATIFLSRPQWAKEKFVFGVISPEAGSLKKCAFYITNINISKFDNAIEAIKLSKINAFKPKRSSPKPAQGRFGALGYPDITVSGIASRKTSFNFIRPANWLLKGGDIDFAIQYSSFLVRDTSGVTIEINGVPVTSRKFSGNPDLPMLINAKIPKHMLGAKNYFVAANFFFDIGHKDCSNQFKDKAWAVIKNSSRLSLAHWYKNNKDLSDFPSLFMAADKLAPTAIFIPDNPSEDILSLAMILSSAIGSAAQVDYGAALIKWPAQIKESLGKENIIMLGSPRDFPWYYQVNKFMPLKFDLQKGVFISDDNVGNLSPEDDYGIIQVCRSPWNSARTVSLFTGISRAGYQLLGKSLADSRLYSKMSGNLVYIPSENNIFSFGRQMKEENRIALGWYFIGWLVVVAAFAAAIFAAYSFIFRKKK